MTKQHAKEDNGGWAGGGCGSGSGAGGAGNDKLGLALIDDLEEPSQLDSVPAINLLSPET